MVEEPRAPKALFDDDPELDRDPADAIRRLDRAEEDLSWLFTGAAAEIGFSAISMEGGGGLVWDDARIAALHMRMRTPARRRSAQKFRRIGLAAAAMTPDDFEIARLSYTPRQVAPEVRHAFTVRGRCLVTLCAARSKAAADLRDRKRPDVGVYELLVWECISLDKTKKPPPRLLRVRDEGEQIKDDMIVRFADVLDERNAILRAERAHDEKMRQRELDEAARKRQPPRPQGLDEQIAACESLYERMVFGTAPR